MKNFLLLFLLTFASFFNVQAQKISGGIKAGVNATTWSGDVIESMQEVFSDNSILSIGSPSIGYHAGGFLSIPFSNNFQLEPGLYYSTKGAMIERTVFESSLFRINGRIQNKSHYIDLPVLAKMTFGKGFNIYAGPQVSYLLENDISAEAGIFGISYEQDINWDPGFRKIDFALAAGAGYQFQNGVQLNIGYDHGLSTLDEGNSNIDAYNRAVKFSLGYRFK